MEAPVMTLFGQCLLLLWGILEEAAQTKVQSNRCY